MKFPEYVNTNILLTTINVLLGNVEVEMRFLVRFSTN